MRSWPNREGASDGPGPGKAAHAPIQDARDGGTANGGTENVDFHVWLCPRLGGPGLRRRGYSKRGHMEKPMPPFSYARDLSKGRCATG